MSIPGTTYSRSPSLYQPSSRMTYCEAVARREVDVVLVGLRVDPGLEVDAVDVVGVPPVPGHLAGLDPRRVGDPRGRGEQVDDRVRHQVLVLLRDAQHAPRVRARALRHRDVVGRPHDLEVAVALELLLERVRRKDAFERGAARAAQPQARVVLDVGVGDRDLHPVGVHHRRGARERPRLELLQGAPGVVPLVVGEEALLLVKVDAPVAREAEARLLAVDPHLRFVQAGLEAVGDSFVEGTEGHGVAALELDPELVVALAHGRRLLAHRRLEDSVHVIAPGGAHPRREAQRRPVDAQRERRVLEQRTAGQQDVEAQPLRGVHAHLEPAVRRDEAGDRGGRCGRREKQAAGSGEDGHDRATSVSRRAARLRAAFAHRRAHRRGVRARSARTTAPPGSPPRGRGPRRP